MHARSVYPTSEPIAGALARFVHEDHQRKVRGAMAAGGAAGGATLKTSYRDYIIYSRSK
jgi:hypothetical protein